MILTAKNYIGCPRLACLGIMGPPLNPSKKHSAVMPEGFQSGTLMPKDVCLTKAVRVIVVVFPVWVGSDRNCKLPDVRRSFSSIAFFPNSKLTRNSLLLGVGDELV